MVDAAKGAAYSAIYFLASNADTLASRSASFLSIAKVPVVDDVPTVLDVDGPLSAVHSISTSLSTSVTLALGMETLSPRKYPTLNIRLGVSAVLMASPLTGPLSTVSWVAAWSS